MSARITTAGLNLMAAKAAAGQTFAIDKMIYAYIAGLDTSATPPLSEAKPSAGNIKLEVALTASGVAGSDTVVFSSVLGPDVGTWDFNWIGLYSSANSVLVAANYLPSQTKRATAGSTMGNSLTKNFAIQHTDIGTLTGVTINAATWQQDFTSLLASKANASHSHPINEVTGLQAALDSKAPTNHTHEASVPPGAVMTFRQATAPAGWLKCNGALVSRTTYADLFAAIGVSDGTGDGVTTFQLPDYRGEFLRGWDDGRGVDAGRGLGSAQADELKGHTHTNRDRYFRENDSSLTGLTYEMAGGAAKGASGSDTDNDAFLYLDTTTGSTGGAETRPRNIALNYCIKY